MNEQISVVIQGPIEPLGSTFETIQSVRKYLPGARVILSTWKPSPSESDAHIAKLNLLKADKVVESKPISAGIHDPHLRLNFNLNRMLTTSQRGLAQVDTPYVLKLRTDTQLRCTPDFEKWSELFSERHAETAIFDEKIIIPDVFTRLVFPPSSISERHPKYRAALHVSDWAAFGRTSDVQRLYGAPAAPDEVTTYMVDKWADFDDQVPWRHHANFQYPPEMWLGLHSVGFPLGITPKSWLEVDDETAEAAEIALMSNFIVLTAKTFGLKSSKHSNLIERPWLDSDAVVSNLTTADYSKMYDNLFETSTFKAVESRDRLVRLRRMSMPLLRLMPRQIRSKLGDLVSRI